SRGGCSSAGLQSGSRSDQSEHMGATHVEELAEYKKKARRHRGFDRLAKAAPSTPRFFEILAQRGVHLGSATARMPELLKRCAAEDLEAGWKASCAQAHQQVSVSTRVQLRLGLARIQ